MDMKRVELQEKYWCTYKFSSINWLCKYLNVDFKVGASMSKLIIRKQILLREQIFHEGGPAPAVPLLRGAMLTALANPFAGRFEADIQWFMETLKPLGLAMATRLIASLGGKDKIEGYGKGAIIGQNGELEHGALWHVPGGYAMREALGKADAIVPSAKKVGAVGTALDVPITHINASYVRSHFDAMELRCPDGPRADEMVVALVMTTGPRIHARVGGLAASEISAGDGLR